MMKSKEQKKIYYVWLLFLFIGINASCTTKIKQENKQKTQNYQNEENKLSILEYTKLVQVKENINTPQYAPLYKKLIRKADEALKEQSFSVMQKTQIPPSGDKHDYISLGPYWWPDSAKADGLPWIRRDGEINPLTREASTDYEIKNKMFRNTNSLAMAYFFSDDKKYALKAKELLKVWFLNEGTKMNPNLNFAQGIPGKNTGRGIGIIEFAGLTNIITAIEILELKAAMDSKTSQGLRKWFQEYLKWLQTSKNGIFEKNTKNNHGTYYDIQVVSIYLFLDKKEEAKQVLETVKSERIAKQIESSGKQPHELARTKALSYSTMNLRGFTQLAFLGTKVNVDLWNYQAENGASIKKAYEFLRPYVEGEKVWDYQQIHSLKKAKKSLKDLFVRAGSQFNVQEYCNVGTDKSRKVTSLLYYCN